MCETDLNDIDEFICAVYKETPFKWNRVNMFHAPCTFPFGFSNITFILMSHHSNTIWILCDQILNCRPLQYSKMTSFRCFEWLVLRLLVEPVKQCKEVISEFYKVRGLQFVSRSHNIQMLLDGGNNIRITQGNFKILWKQIIFMDNIYWKSLRLIMMINMLINA